MSLVKKIPQRIQEIDCRAICVNNGTVEVVFVRHIKRYLILIRSFVNFIQNYQEGRPIGKRATSHKMLRQVSYSFQKLRKQSITNKNHEEREGRGGYRGREEKKDKGERGGKGMEEEWEG